jgi:signal transduction histidine kinase
VTPPSADPGRTHSERVVVVTPSRRDAEATCRFLEAARIGCTALHAPADAEAEVRAGIGALVLTDFVLSDPGSAGLMRTLQEQPAWSNLPVLIVSGATLSVTELPAGLGNVTVLDRPTSGRAIVSAVQAALRGRRWQYQIRDQIAELTAVERALRLADQHKDSFLATLAHELRNPLAPIRTGVQLLRSENVDRAQLERVRAMIERQVGHLVKLIDELLDVSRMTTGKVVLQRTTMDLRSAVQQAIEGAQPAVAAAAHRFEARLPPTPVWVLGDATRLAQSIGNLIHNAAKYTPDGGRIEVALVVLAGEALVSVRDDGLGIPPAMQARVFDMFTQVDRTLQRAQGGLGIGLSLVKNLVELHGGRVEVHSEGDDRGSTFTIALPLAAPGEAAGAQDRGDVPALASAARPLRVLVVDDNRDAADSLALLLESIGHEAAVRYGGTEALDAASRLQPDAVLCDLGMPGMGGFELAARLRDDRRLDRTLLVAVTGWGAEQDRLRSHRAGFDVHLTKPVSLERLAELLERGRPPH